MTRIHRGLIIAAIAIVAAGLATGLTLAFTGGPGSSPDAAAGGGPGNYDFYQSAMGSLAGGSMMGGAGRAMMGQSGYSWMAGGADAPGL